MPRSGHVTGGVGIHDIQIDRGGRLLVAVTLYNCLAELDGRGSFSPVWRPAFIDAMVNQDRCHLNGFRLEDGEPAYATVVGPSNDADGWRAMRANGGQVIDVRTDRVVVDGLSMPHTPRLYKGCLYVLDAGSGWFGRVDREAGRFERLVWCPGFPRGLSLHDDFAVIGLSKPRNKVFAGLPLDGELRRRGADPISKGIHSTAPQCPQARERTPPAPREHQIQGAGRGGPRPLERMAAEHGQTVEQAQAALGRAAETELAPGFRGQLSPGAECRTFSFPDRRSTVPARVAWRLRRVTGRPRPASERLKIFPMFRYGRAPGADLA